MPTITARANRLSGKLGSEWRITCSPWQRAPASGNSSAGKGACSSRLTISRIPTTASPARISRNTKYAAGRSGPLSKLEPAWK